MFIFNHKSEPFDRVKPLYHTNNRRWLCNALISGLILYIITFQINHSGQMRSI